MTQPAKIAEMCPKRKICLAIVPNGATPGQTGGLHEIVNHRHRGNTHGLFMAVSQSYRTVPTDTVVVLNTNPASTQVASHDATPAVLGANPPIGSRSISTPS